MQSKNRTILFSIILLCTVGGAKGQGIYPQMPTGPGESLTLATDRSIYAVSEVANFSSFYTPPPGISPETWSTVLYVELIRWNGSKIARCKVPILNDHASGTIFIPDHIESGVYYLRAYTRWMRNFSPYVYTYLPLTIINPTTKKTERGPVNNDSIQQLVQVSYTMNEQDVEISGLGIETSRQSVLDIDMRLIKEDLSGIYTISIVRKVPGAGLNQSIGFLPPGVQNENLKMIFYPELRGMALTGKVIDRNSGRILPGIQLGLSSTIDPFYFTVTSSDSSGQFRFTFPSLQDEFEFHLININPGDDGAEILIDADFCNRQVSLPYIPFHLMEDQKEIISDIVRNAQLQDRYRAQELSEKFMSFKPFYGEPSRIILEKDFIELDNLEEFLYELVYEATVRYDEGTPIITLSGEKTLASYPVLLLMDNIPVRDVKSLLEVECRKVQRIEILNKGYVIGDFMYSGIIAFYSEKGDMAGMRSGLNSHYFSLEMFEPDSGESSETDQELSSLHIPDRRNTLFWKPYVPISAGKTLSLSFRTADSPGEYVLYLRGLDNYGRPVSYTGPSIVVN